MPLSGLSLFSHTIPATIFFSYVNSHWHHTPNLILLGPTQISRVPVYSFLIKTPHSEFLLHHNFISLLLDNLFGIQSRAGLACAEPYAEDLMGIDESLAEKFEQPLKDNLAALKWASSRVVSMPYHYHHTSRQTLIPLSFKVSTVMFFVITKSQLVC